MTNIYLNKTSIGQFTALSIISLII